MPDQALEEALAPRLRLAGDTGSLTKFGDFMAERTLEKGTGIVLLYRVEGALEVALMPASDEDYASVRTHRSAMLPRLTHVARPLVLLPAGDEDYASVRARVTLSCIQEQSV